MEIAAMERGEQIRPMERPVKEIGSQHGNGPIAPTPPLLLRAASWLSYVAALGLIAVGYETTANGFLLAAPWFLLGLGLMSGAPSAWRIAWGVAGFYAILCGGVSEGFFPAPVDARWEAMIGLVFLLVFVFCLASPSARRHIRTVDESKLRPRL